MRRAELGPTRIAGALILMSGIVMFHGAQAAGCVVGQLGPVANGRELTTSWCTDARTEKVAAIAVVEYLLQTADRHGGGDIETTPIVERRMHPTETIAASASTSPW